MLEPETFTCVTSFQILSLQTASKLMWQCDIARLVWATPMPNGYIEICPIYTIFALFVQVLAIVVTLALAVIGGTLAGLVARYGLLLQGVSMLHGLAH